MGIITPSGCIPGPDADLDGMFGCDPADECCDGTGVCQAGSCQAGDGTKGVCTFSGAILAGPPCGCAIGGAAGVGGPGGDPGTTEPESYSDGASMRDFVGELTAADFPPGSPQQIRFFETGCDNGLAPACVGLAIGHAVVANADLPLAAEAALRACELGSGEGCYLLGGAYATGSGVAEDEPLADLMFAQSCEMGLELGCEGAGSLPEAMQIIASRLE